MDDARKFKRVAVSFIVLYKVDSPLIVRVAIGGREFDAEALDISEGGMAILTKHTNYAIPAFTVVLVRFAVINEHAGPGALRCKSMEVKAEVRSSLFLKEKKAYRLGIRFMDIASAERKFIADFIKMSTPNLSPGR